MSNSEHHKDSCSYAVGTANQILTLTSAGLAFIVALALGAGEPLSAAWYWCGGLLMVSILMGLLFAMSVVAHINQVQTYDVYSGMLKAFSIVQIVTFLAAIIMLSYIVIDVIPKGQVKNVSELNIKAGDKEIHQQIPDNVILSINVSTGNLIQIDMKPK